MSDVLSDTLALEANGSTHELRAPLVALLRQVLPRRGLVLELGSGNGEHAVFISARFPYLMWQPSDPDPGRRAAIERSIATTSADNVAAPLDLDVTQEEWPVERADAILCCNVLHAAPVEATAGLMCGAARVLPPGAPLMLCGLFLCGGDGPRVLDYDRKLREHDPTWGLRPIDDVLSAARARGLRLEETREMPADHLALVLELGRDP